MGARFNRMGGLGTNTAQKSRERRLFIVGSTLLFTSLLIIAALVVQSQSAQASKRISSEPVTEEVTLSSINLIAPVVKVAKGTKLSARDLQTVPWPRDRVPEGALRKIEDVENMFAAVTLVEGQPVTRGSVSSTAPIVGLSEKLPPGHRAVTINVNAATVVEGWAQPGAHVDVLLTYLDPKDGLNKTRVVMENAVVLSFGGSTKAIDNSDDTSVTQAQMNVTTVTLSMPLEDSLKVQTAVSLGRISLALRNNNDIAPASKEIFAADEWDQRHKSAPIQSRPSVAKGYAKYTEKDGAEKQFVLGPDEKWQSSGQEEEY